MQNDLGQSRQFPLLYLLLSLVILLNIYDMAFTLYWCDIFGVNAETNPLLYHLMCINPILAVSFKTLMVLIFTCLILFAARINIKQAYRGTCFTAVIYLIVAGWHTVLKYCSCL